MTAQVRSAVGSDLNKFRARRAECDCRWSRKGGRGKDDRGREPGDRPQPDRRAGRVIDGDIYGPNVPIMLGIQTQLTTDGQKIVPAEQYGLQLVSMAFLTQDDSAVIWRGPMLHGVVQQFFREVRVEEHRLPDRRSAAGHGRRGAQPQPECTRCRRGGRHDATDRVAGRYPPGHSHVSEVERAAAGLIENMSHFVCPTCRRRATSSGKAEASARQTWGFHFSVAFPSTSRSAWAATPASRSSSASRNHPPPNASDGRRTARRADLDRELQENGDSADASKVVGISEVESRLLSTVDRRLRSRVDIAHVPEMRSGSEDQERHAPAEAPRLICGTIRMLTIVKRKPALT